MKQTNQTKLTMDSWIPEEELPVRAGLHILRDNDQDDLRADDEIMDSHEFIRCYLLSEMELLLQIPGAELDHAFFIGDHTVADGGYGAFDTHDFQKQLRPFNRSAYAFQKLLERVKDLAILHSSIVGEEGQSNTRARYEGLMERAFSEKLMKLSEKLHTASDVSKVDDAKVRIRRISRQIQECRRAWEKFSPPS